VDEVMQQYRCSDVSELRPLSEASSTRPSFMFITSLDSLNGERYDAVQDGIPGIGKDDASGAALTTSRVNAEADAISSEVQVAISSRYRKETSSDTRLVGQQLVAPKKVEMKEEKKDFVFSSSVDTTSSSSAPNKEKVPCKAAVPVPARRGDDCLPSIK